MNIIEKIARTTKTILKIILIVVSFILLYLGVEYVTSSIQIKGEKSENKNVTIYIQTNGVHTDLVLPVKNETHDWRNQIDIATTKANDTNAQYVAIGWGDKGFYLETPSWDELKASTALKAALGLSSTAMHCTFHNNIYENENRKKIEISSEQYLRLIAFINKSFQWENDKSILVDTDIRYDNYDTFYEATGHYTLFKTCNTWTNQALKAAGLNACYWAAFEKRIMEKYD